MQLSMVRPFADNEDFVKEVPGLYFTDEGAGSSIAGYFNLDASGSLIEFVLSYWSRRYHCEGV